MGRTTFLQFSPPNITEEEITEVAETLRSGWITTGPQTKRFEQEFCRYLGAPGALALNSCTAALHSALVATGIGPGDEVITTPLTFTASVNVIEHVQARPVLVDVEEDTLNIDPTQIERAITPRTRAVMPVHYSGHPVDLDPINDLSKHHDLVVVEDAAHALPARYKGRLIGSGTNPVAFSFYATKNLTTGEGGMLTGDPELLQKARVVSLHGMSKNAWNRYQEGGSWSYDVLLPGFKYNMSDVQAAIGLAQLRRFHQLQARRLELVNRYHAAFSAEEALQLPVEREGTEHAWHLYVLRLRSECLRITRNEFVEGLTAKNIGSAVHFIPIPLHSFYRDKYGYSPSDYPVAVGNYERMVSLPLSPALSNADIDDVIEAVLDLVREHRR